MRNTTGLLVVYFDIVDECEIRGKPDDPVSIDRDITIVAGASSRSTKEGCQPLDGETAMVLDEVGRYDENLKRPFVNRLAELVSWSQE